MYIFKLFPSRKKLETMRKKLKDKKNIKNSEENQFGLVWIFKFILEMIFLLCWVFPDLLIILTLFILLLHTLT